MSSKKPLTLATCASLLTLSSGCVSFRPTNELPALPGPLRECVDRAPYPLPPGPYNERRSTEVLGEVILSEKSYRLCAASVAGFYDALAESRKRRANQP